MKNTPNPDLGLWARQWGATAVPFGELSADAWLDTPDSDLSRPRSTKPTPG